VRHNRSRRLASGLVTAAAVLLLSACGDGVAPGVAAQVADEVITTDEVDDLATVICEIDKGAGQAGKPMSAQRATALTVLLGIEIGRGVGDVDAVPPQQVNQSLQAAAEARRLVPEELRSYFDEVVRESTRSAIAVDAAAAAALAETGEGPPDPAAVQEEAARLQQDYLEEHPVEVDPRFGVYQNGQVVSGDGSVSVAVSERARSLVPQGTDDLGAQPEADLPPSQVCG
jgi:hypothetical protein